jgi:hypothetical protein
LSHFACLFIPAPRPKGDRDTSLPGSDSRRNDIFCSQDQLNISRPACILPRSVRAIPFLQNAKEASHILDNFTTILTCKLSFGVLLPDRDGLLDGISGRCIWLKRFINEFVGGDEGG